MEAEQAVMSALIQAARPGRALDVGTGTGRYLLVLRSAGATLVVGADRSLPMLDRRTPGSPVVCADAGRLPFRHGSFDLVCSSLMVGDLEDPTAWVGEAARLLVPGGHLIYSDFHPSWAARGWRRTFTSTDGRRFELSYFAHSIDRHLAALEEASLAVRAIREPRVPGRPAPVVVIFHAVRRRTADPAA
jgi:malonyl-CoA O-methyltransferase